MMSIGFLLGVLVASGVGYLIGVIAERDRYAEPVVYVPSAYQLRAWKKERR